VPTCTAEWRGCSAHSARAPSSTWGARTALRAALPAPGPWLVGLDASETLLRDRPPRVLRADARRLPVRDRAVDAVTALDVLYHLPDPMPALREARRVLRAGGHLLAATIACTDLPEFSTYWSRSATSFDAEDASGLLARVFDSMAVFAWDAPLVTLPDAAAIRRYLIGRQVRAEIAVAAADELPTPLSVTKRGALIVAGRDR
jgi:SAM-dependent methyltransferase